MKKFLKKSNKKNTIVQAIFKNIPGKICEGIGVLTAEDQDKIVIAFSAKRDKIIDSINISRNNLISLKTLKSGNIAILK